MNIILADVQSLNANRSEPISETDAGDDRFSDLMEQHLSQDVDLTPQTEFPQAIDIKGLYIEDRNSAETQISLPVDGQTAESWLQYQSDEDVSTTVESPLYPLAVDIGKPQVADLSDNPSDADLIAVHAVNPAIGEGLPVNGNILPPAEIPVKDPVSSPVSEMPILTPGMRDNLSKQDRQASTHSIRLEDDDVEAVVNVKPKPKPNDPRIVDTAAQPQSGKIPEPVKMELTIDNFNVVKTSEFQSLHSGISDIVDNSSGQLRHLNPVITGPAPNLPNSPLLPHLEPLNLSSARDNAAIGNGLGERINWMVNQKLNTATIRIDPPMLGRLEVHIHVGDEATNVTINTQHAHTRDMIDGASFRLRDFLQENGYQNVNVDVSHQQQQHQQASDQAADHSGPGGEGRLQSQDSVAADNAPKGNYFSSDSVVDYFA